MNGEAAIFAAGLSKRFAGAPGDAVDAVALDIPQGCIAGLVGPDGAGKTTLLRMLAGLLTPSGGEARVAGINPVADPDALRRAIGYMPQKFGLYEDLTVQENLNLYADLREVAKADRTQDFARLLALTDLAPFTARYAGKLSGGMKQKLGLACSLLGKPRALLLDEPGVGVDPISRRELWKLIRALSADGITVLLSTAYLDEAEACDMVYLMNQGRIQAAGSPSALTEGLAGRCLRLSGIAGNRRLVLQKLLRQPALMDGTIQGSGLRLLLREAGRWPDLAQADAGPGASLETAPPRLEDAFISLLGGGPGGDSVLAEVMPPAPPHHEESVIEARGLSKRFGDFYATDDVSFAVRRGEVFGLLGPNGAGKSTTFKMECGLLKPTAGQALVMGLDLKASPTAARQQLGYMAQKFSLYAQLSVRRNLMFFSGVYGLAGQKQRDKVAQMERVFGLSPYMDSPSGELPLGFKQRLALACAVMHEPPLLFLDEPTSGVDPVTRREFWTHINGLAQKGVTVLVTTHFMDEAEYCDRIALVYRGKLLALDKPDALKQSVASETRPNPTMEDAFIQLVEEADR
ncbi:ATP-binding cassette domain-containing protein [Chromobacterium sp. IIBBL 290-4]|uniref:ATP-binding cassette domain-containing protein n=1 Tax=Chromobacterium sp. IIBBL 290-4 TaxID=2953890 RepID=UPI0020B7F518|nr:ATP-binding cassette domain-containing protein [Chromobacterium sp. IIBBL 290-4]UTH73625.1 ATP-binding cassette domain-containing protein [Chromobacterium sp. IIBBL 290-4]